MAHLAVAPADRTLSPGYAAPFCDVSGDAASSFFHPDGYSLWLSTAELGAGTTITWGDEHGDEAVYVLEGSVTVDGRICDDGGVVIVEAGVATTLHVDRPTTAIHVGPADPQSPREGLLGPAAGENHVAHVIPLADSVRVGDDVAMVSFADATCPTCRLAIFLGEADHEITAPSHLHSEDEIIHVLSGRLRMGPQLLEPGMSVAIPANHRYGFRTDGPFCFINYRRDVSSVTVAPGSTPFLETVEVVSRQLAEAGGPSNADLLG